MSKLKYLYVYLAVSIFTYSSACAHSGGTDSSGGHYNRKTGGYHYHNSGYSKRSSPSTGSSYASPSYPTPASSNIAQCYRADGSVVFSLKSCSEAGYLSEAPPVAEAVKAYTNKLRSTSPGVRDKTQEASIPYLIKLPERDNAGKMRIAKCPKCLWTLGYYDSMSSTQVQCSRCREPRIVP